jgi:hypothetical protein
MENPVSEHVLALADTSALVAHDLSAQLHVLNFCTEELKRHTSFEGQRFLDQLSNSTKNLGLLLSHFRSHLRIQFHPDGDYSVNEILDAIKHSLNTHHFAQIERVNIALQGESEDRVPFRFAWDSFHILFSLCSVLIEKSSSAPLNIRIRIREKRWIELEHTVDLADEKWLATSLSEEVGKGNRRRGIGLQLLSGDFAYPLVVSEHGHKVQVDLVGGRC